MEIAKVKMKADNCLILHLYLYFMVDIITNAYYVYGLLVLYRMTTTCPYMHL